MNARAPLLCLWCAGLGALLGAPRAQAAPDDVGARIARVQALLADWQLDEAAAIAERLERELPDVPPVQAVVGAVRFHQGDYQGAVRLLRRASEGGDTVPLLPLAESTLAETRGYVAMESAHFVVRVPPGKDEVLQPIAIEALEAAWSSIGAAFDYQPKHKIVVDILHDARGLASVSTLTQKEIETSGTIAICKFNRLMATSPKALARGYSWLDTLAHEFVHLVVSEQSHNNVPVWLHEGLAKFNETRWRGAPGLALEPASENLLAAALKKDKLITFEQMHPSMAKLPSQADAALAFAEVFTVVEMLEQARADAGARRPIAALLEALRDGATLDAALVTATGGDLAALQRQWRAYLKTRAFHLMPGAEPKKLTFVKDARKGATGVEEREDEAALDEAKGKAGRQFVRLGNLLRGQRRLRAATVEYQKAVEQVGLHSPALHNRLAGVYLELARSTPPRRCWPTRSAPSRPTRRPTCCSGGWRCAAKTGRPRARTTSRPRGRRPSTPRSTSRCTRWRARPRTRRSRLARSARSSCSPGRRARRRRCRRRPRTVRPSASSRCARGPGGACCSTVLTPASPRRSSTIGWPPARTACACSIR
ncbi:MAG: hypothetical protein A2138_22555 [Deltaproteobacteria bacterium RBG_16_71_12]|nr:MAG: hypothetical protein A2138_22555 [Deltaproteobacteria bacterium RBG_16_71_12]